MGRIGSFKFTSVEKVHLKMSLKILWCLAIKYMCTICMLCLQRSEVGFGSPEIRVAGDCELTCICWELNLCPQEEQPVLSAAVHIFV